MEPKTETPNQKKFTRREFLKLASTGGVAVAVSLKGLEQAFYQIVTTGVRDSGMNDLAITAALSASETSAKSENPGYRPMLDLIKEGIDGYTSGTGKTAFFKKIADYQGPEYYADLVQDYASTDLVPRLPDKLAITLASNLPRGAFASFSQSQTVISGFDQLFTVGSGFEKRFRASHPELIHKTGMFISSDQVEETMAQVAKVEINELKLKIQQPVSASFVLTHFLEKNDGDIAASIFDTAIFLKVMARNDPDTGKFSAGEANVDWYRQNIKDEYQGPNYALSDKGERLNLIGKPYHSWNIVALLQFIPVEVIRLGVIQRQWDTFEDQGLDKTRADLQTLKDLREVEQLLLSYSK